MLDLVTLTLRVVNVDRPPLLTLTPAIGTGSRVGNYLRYATRTNQTIQTLFASLTHGLWAMPTLHFYYFTQLVHLIRSSLIIKGRSE
jgi:hypothetical protein